MKKQTKSSLTNKLDKECSRIIRSQGQCFWCKIITHEKLQCAHIYSRTYRNTRWDLNNLIPLCISCHFQAHRNPLLFTTLVQHYLGEYELNCLKQRHNTIKRWTISEMQDLLETLKCIQ